MATFHGLYVYAGSKEPPEKVWLDGTESPWSEGQQKPDAYRTTGARALPLPTREPPVTGRGSINY